MIYIAGSSSEMDKVIDVYKNLDLPVSHAWWDIVYTVGHANPPDADPAEKLRWAREDLNGVFSCDLFVLVWPKTYSVGCFTELGYAYAMGKPIFVYAENRPVSIFSELGQWVGADDSALQQIRAAYDRISKIRY